MTLVLPMSVTVQPPAPAAGDGRGISRTKAAFGSLGLSAVIHGAAIGALVVWGTVDLSDFTRGGEQTPVIELTLASAENTGGPTVETAPPEETETPPLATPMEAAKAEEPQAEPPPADLALAMPVPTPAEVVLPLPAPVVKPQPVKPVARPVEKKVEKKPASPRHVARKEERKETKTAEMTRPQGVESRRSGSGGTTASAGTAEISDYRAAVLARIARFKSYPERARSAGVVGRVGLSFLVTRSGTVAGVRIARSSGDATLDQAALDMVRQAAPFPPPPPGSPASLQFSPAINYSLH